MITELSAQNFKSWENTGKLQIAPLTGFFGANSSGKTSIFQTLLMLKQTAERPPEWDGAIDFGDEGSVVNLCSFNEVIHRHKSGLSLDISVSWKLPEKLIIGGRGAAGQALPRTPRSSNRLEVGALSFSTTIVSAGADSVVVDGFGYMSDEYEFFGIVRDSDSQYKLICPPNFRLQGAFSSFHFDATGFVTDLRGCQIPRFCRLSGHLRICFPASTTSARSANRLDTTIYMAVNTQRGWSVWGTGNIRTAFRTDSTPLNR